MKPNTIQRCCEVLRFLTTLRRAKAFFLMLYREPGLQLLPGKKPTLPCLTGRIRRCTDVLTEIPLGLWSNSIELIRLLCPPRGPLCIFRHSQ